MKGKVLLVDNETDLVGIVKLNLEDEGYEVQTAYDGKQALAKIAIWDPDVVILDIMMPEVDGWEVLRRLRREGRLRNPRVIMLTCRTEDESRSLCFELGADDYMPKPFSVKELCEHVERNIIANKRS